MELFFLHVQLKSHENAFQCGIMTFSVSFSNNEVTMFTRVFS